MSAKDGEGVQMFSQLGNDGLLAFMENFAKDHFLPTMFVDYRKTVQQAISNGNIIYSMCFVLLMTVCHVSVMNPILD
ncbi:MAP kinase kinase kinase [Castilleja foliolosa]|uniref:MAP kinase kinase kinase n=1 Tax=Castilleja foliolosa TaxID=1961234 RepID=A0ABD3EA28_9LAMI